MKLAPDVPVLLEESHDGGDYHISRRMPACCETSRRFPDHWTRHQRRAKRSIQHRRSCSDVAGTDIGSCSSVVVGAICARAVTESVGIPSIAGRIQAAKATTIAQEIKLFAVINT